VPPVPMRLLILGGTRFVGRALVDSALDAGCAVTLLNNDPRGPSIPQLERICVDRHAPDEVSIALNGRCWDFVIDTWQGAPAPVSFTAELLRDSADCYCYISSTTVYQIPFRTAVREDYPRLARPYLDPRSYAARKAAAEDAVKAAFRDRALIIRPGLIVGPWEYPGRLPWWLRKMRDYPRVICPEPRARRIQWIDSRDLADWLVHCAETGTRGTYNLACPPEATFECLLVDCRRIAGGIAELCWISEASLGHAGVQPWTELPLWLPPSDKYGDIYNIDASSAVAAGARFRPLQQTVEDVWKWMSQLGDVALDAFIEQRPWLTRYKEEQILATEACQALAPRTAGG
jgi:2'-hydroxyisoflavone reductase